MLRGIIESVFGLLAFFGFLHLGGYGLLDWVRKETLTAVHRELVHGYDEFDQFVEKTTGLKWNDDPDGPIVIPTTEASGKKHAAIAKRLRMNRKSYEGRDVIAELVQHMEQEKSKN